MKIRFNTLISVLTAAVMAATLTACQGGGELSGKNYSENESSASTTISDSTSSVISSKDPENNSSIFIRKTSKVVKTPLKTVI